MLAAEPTGPEIPARLAALGRPHLVLILVDTLCADFTTPYGFAEDTSPELARWAERGVLFERDRSQSSWTKMSVASLLARSGVKQVSPGGDDRLGPLGERGTAS